MNNKKNKSINPNLNEEIILKTKNLSFIMKMNINKDLNMSKINLNN